MRLSQSTFTFLAFVALFLSCSKNDHEVPPGVCRYLGQNYTMDQTAGGFSSHETYISSFEQDQDGKLLKATGIRKTIKAANTNTDGRSEVTETNTFTLKYDQQGFLTELTNIKLLEQEGGLAATFLYDNYTAYHHGRIETKEVTTFQYESDLLRNSTRTRVVDFKSEKNQDVKVNADNKKEYIYETDGVIKTITETIGNSFTITQFKNGVKLSTPTTTYDEKGQVIKALYVGGEYNLTYDSKGNLITYEGTYQSKQLFLETRTYDNNTNPDKLLPAKFKGIPEEMRILQFTDGVNNIVSSKSVYPDRPPYEEKNVYTYNFAGYPASAVSTFTQADALTTKTTTYNYQDCQ